MRHWSTYEHVFDVEAEGREAGIPGERVLGITQLEG